jgi:hypothetical protein
MVRRLHHSSDLPILNLNTSYLTVDVRSLTIGTKQVTNSFWEPAQYIDKMSGCQVDHLSRVKQSTPLGTALFINLRILDAFIQYIILAQGLADPLINALHLSTTPVDSTPSIVFGLPLRLLVVLAMVTGATIKSIYWVSYISNEEMPASNALKVSVFEIFFSSTNSILSLTKSPSNSVTTTLLLLGYAFGWYVEIAAETERKKFKDNPQNKGKLYTNGLFRFARHINYGAYLLRKSSQALVCGGRKWDLAVATYHFLNFAKRGIPVLDVYCEKRVSLSKCAICQTKLTAFSMAINGKLSRKMVPQNDVFHSWLFAIALRRPR